VGKNRYKRAIEILKSTNIDEKIKSLEENFPTNNTRGVYNGRTKTNIDSDQLELQNSDAYWKGSSEIKLEINSDFSQDYLEHDPTGTDTSGLIGEDGTVFSELPPGGNHFILGPIVDGFVSNESGTYTNIGYIQKDTRQFVLLAKIEGQWKENMHGSYPIWKGNSEGLVIYNKNFTLEMAQWIREKINNGNYSKNVPYFYSGSGVKNLDNPNSPPNMKSGNVISPITNENETQVFTPAQDQEIELQLNKFFIDTNNKNEFDYNVGKLAAKMSIKQMGELIKRANNRWGK
jgi:hypothetical protein